MKILFISHTYPPIMGGVESQNYNLAESLKKIAEVKIFSNGKGKIWLPIFLPVVFLKALFSMKNFDACLLGNGVLAPIGSALKIFHSKKRFFSVVHGLDITFANKKGFLSKVYKNINIPALKKLDKLFMVGNPTVEEAIKIGIDQEKCTVIHNGVNVFDFKENHSREELEKIFGEDITGKKIILRLGRFVPHKGTDWFIKNVMPKMEEDICMIATGYRVSKNTAGDQDNFSECEKAIKENNLENRVKLLPNLSQSDLKILLNTCDLVVSPNIKTPGTMEGFGINVIEAGGCERVVLASNLEGLQDAIKDGENGFLLPSGDANAWAEKIKEVLSDDNFRKEFGAKAKRFVEENYSWEKISAKYLEEIKKLVNK